MSSNKSLTHQHPSIGSVDDMVKTLSKNCTHLLQELQRHEREWGRMDSVLAVGLRPPDERRTSGLWRVQEILEWD